MKIYRIAQEYKAISEEDDDCQELQEQAWKVFRSNSIYPNRSKEISNIALDDGTVIGAVAAGWDRYGNEKAIYGFDIAVDKSNQGMRIGTNWLKGITRHGSRKRFENGRVVHSERASNRQPHRRVAEGTPRRWDLCEHGDLL